MSRTSVKEILRDIDLLGEDDRVKLERELARRLEREWKQEAAKARTLARQRKINQDMIDRIIERRRPSLHGTIKQ